jgi:O-antigen ligase
MSISNLIKKIDYSDIIFYFLCGILFTVFLMPFNSFDPINVIQININGKDVLVNNLFQSNMNIFFGRFTVMFWGSSLALLMILFSRNIINDIIKTILSFSITVQISILFFFVFSIISSIFALSPTIALKATSYIFAMLIISIFIGNYTRDKPHQIKVLYITVLLSIIFYSGMLLLQLSLSNLSIYGATVAGNIQKDLLYTYNTINPRLIDNYFSWFTPFLLLPWILNYRPIFKTGSFIAISMIWFVVINHGCRAIFAEYIVIAIFLLIYDRKLFIQVFKIILITMLVGYLMTICYDMFIRADENIKITTTLIREGGSGRLATWNEAFHMGLEHPWLGVGQWHYVEYTQQTGDKYPHNILLEMWSQCGIPAFICFMIVLISAVKYGFKNIRNILSKKPYNIIILMLVAGMFDGMVSALFKSPVGTIAAIFVFGLCLAFYSPKYIGQISQLTLSRYRIVLMIAIFFMVVAPFIWTPQWW